MQGKVKKVFKYIDNKFFQCKLRSVYSKLLRIKEKELMCSYDNTVHYDLSIKEQMEAIDIQKTFPFEQLDLCVLYLLFKELIMQSETGIYKELFCTVFDYAGGVKHNYGCRRQCSFMKGYAKKEYSQKTGLYITKILHGMMICTSWRVTWH